MIADDAEWMSSVRAAAAAATSLTAADATWREISARIDREDIVVLPPASGRAGRRARPAAVAAGLLLCAGVAAALVPQTGVRAWIERRLGGGSDAVVPAPPAPAPTPVELALAPSNGALHVEVTAPRAPLRLRVRLTDSADMTVRALGGAAAATFLAGTGRLEIEGAAGGEIVVSLPRDARVITIAVNGVRAVEMRSARLTVFGAGADTVGTEIVLPLR